MAFILADQHTGGLIIALVVLWLIVAVGFAINKWLGVALAIVAAILTLGAGVVDMNWSNQ